MTNYEIDRVNPADIAYGALEELDREVCHFCEVVVMADSVCPWSIWCPHCGASPYRRCRLPSGHRAASMHVERVEEAERHDRAKGLTYALSPAAEPDSSEEVGLREQYLEISHGDVDEAAAYLALCLNRDDPAELKVGYSIPNAVLAAQDVFPEVSAERIRFLNRWPLS